MEFPVDYDIVTKLTSCRIVKTDITLFTKVEIMVVFFSEDRKQNKMQQLVMDTSNGYNEWGGDDTYLVDWVKAHIQPPN